MDPVENNRSRCGVYETRKRTVPLAYQESTRIRIALAEQQRVANKRLDLADRIQPIRQA